MKDKEEEEEATILTGSYNGLMGCFTRLTEGLTWWLGMGPTKRLKYLSDKKWKQCPNGWGSGIWGILSDEWWVAKIEWRVMSGENWVTSDEWSVMKIEWRVMKKKKKPNKAKLLLLSKDKSYNMGDIHNASNINLDFPIDRFISFINLYNFKILIKALWLMS